MLIIVLPLFAVFPAHRGSKGSGGDSRTAPEQPDPAGELPEADGAAERPDRYREPDGAGQGESAERSAGQGPGLENLWEVHPRWNLTSISVLFSGVHTRGLSVQAHQEGAAAEDVLPGSYFNASTRLNQ